MPSYQIKSMNPEKKKYVIHQHSATAPAPNPRSRVKFNLKNAENLIDNMYNKMVKKR